MTGDSIRNIQTVRDALFDQMDRLAKARDPEKEIGRSKAMAELAQVMINSARVEVDYINATDTIGSGFIPEKPKAPPTGVIGTTVHRISDRSG